MESGLASSVLWLAVLLHCTCTQVLGPQTPDTQILGEVTPWMDIYNRSHCHINNNNNTGVLPVSVTPWMDIYNRSHCHINNNNNTGVLPVSVTPWMDIYNRSHCQPRWLLLSILSEFPEHSDFLFLPSCVSVQRCAGCCSDEALRCVPTHTHSVTMQVIKTKFSRSELMEISVTQHKHCQCRLSAPGVNKGKKRRRKGKRGRETPTIPRSLCHLCPQHGTLNPETCKCDCLQSEEHCHQQTQRLNKERCRCEELRR
ncbi:vascular endothelial growth factor B isoform X2 [Ascaphus truei]|uniref:vascular endothelial growth factor B isoform X2 n=1 Tax=Ascaphus truei TaxID=8439 RepID=UPI003F59E4F5